MSACTAKKEDKIEREDFTTLSDFVESVIVIIQIGIEEQHHGELGKHETQLQREKRDREWTL